MGETLLCTIEQYKYLGLVLNEFLDFNIKAQVLSDAANRALGSIINILILDYSKVGFVLYWTMEVKYGNSDILIKLIQSKIKLFKYTWGFTGLLPLQQSMGTWVGHISVRRKVCIVHFWNRIISLDPQCLPIKVLEWDIHFNGNT